MEEAEYDFYPDQVAKIKEENFIYDYFEAINQGKTELYFSMMDEELIGNENMQEMWKTAFSSLKLIKVVSTVSYTHLRAHETVLDLVCRLLLEKKKKKQ